MSGTDNLNDTTRKSLLGAAICGTTAFVGSVVGGPVGLAIGSAVGGAITAHFIGKCYHKIDSEFELS